MNIRTLTCAAVGAVCLLTAPGIALAGSPAQWVRDSIREVGKTSPSQQPGDELTQEQRSEMSRIFGELCDFPEMARMALGRHWRDISPKQRTEFTHLFRKLLEQSHMWQMSTHAGAEQRFIGESIDDGRAVVEAEVKMDDGDIPVNYFLVRNNEAWKIYDVGVDGVRLSQIYRSQFNKVILKGSFEDLMQRMSRKLEEIALEAAVRQ
ncbi:MAG: phospholipid-binding protein MlaC [Candidatus Methylomirabilales bacterium]